MDCGRICACLFHVCDGVWGQQLQMYGIKTAFFSSLYTLCCVITKRPVQPCTVFHPGMAGVPLSLKCWLYLIYGTLSDSVLHHKLLRHHQYVNLRPKTRTALFSSSAFICLFSSLFLHVVHTLILYKRILTMNHSICICNVWTNVTFVLLHRLAPCLSFVGLFWLVSVFFFYWSLKPYFLVCRFSQ